MSAPIICPESAVFREINGEKFAVIRYASGSHRFDVTSYPVDSLHLLQCAWAFVTIAEIETGNTLTGMPLD